MITTALDSPADQILDAACDGAVEALRSDDPDPTAILAGLDSAVVAAARVMAA